MASSIQCDDVHFEIIKQAILETLNTTDKSNENVNIKHFKEYYDKNYFCNHLNKFNNSDKLIEQYTEIINEYVSKYGINKNINQTFPTYSSLEYTTYNRNKLDDYEIDGLGKFKKNRYNNLLLEEDKLNEIEEIEKNENQKTIQENRDFVLKNQINIDTGELPFPLSCFQDTKDLGEGRDTIYQTNSNRRYNYNENENSDTSAMINLPSNYGECEKISYININSTDFIRPETLPKNELALLLNDVNTLTSTDNINYTDYKIKLSEYGDDTNYYVTEIELVQCSIPVTYFNFAEILKNNKFYIYITSNNISNPIEITIKDGFYLPDDLANELEYQLNQTCYQLYDNDVSINILQQENNSINVLEKSQLKCFKVFYNKVTQKFIIGNTFEEFELKEFSNKTYCLRDLGFTFKIDKISSINDKTKLPISYLDYKKIWLTPYIDSLNIHYFESDFAPKLLGPRVIYMCLSNSNTNPYSSDINNIQSFKNSKKNCFAKIPITDLPYAEIQDSKNGYLQNKFKKVEGSLTIKDLYFHFFYIINNTIIKIDFKNNEFNFTLKICGYEIKQQ